MAAGTYDLVAGQGPGKAMRISHVDPAVIPQSCPTATRIGSGSGKALHQAIRVKTTAGPGGRQTARLCPR